MKNTLKRKKHKFIAVVSALAVIAGTISGIAANELTENTIEMEYEAPELHLIQGAEEYDLTEGIQYDAEKYTLEVINTGGFDIDLLGSYEVSYRLTMITQTSVGTLPESTGEPEATETPEAMETPAATEIAAATEIPAATGTPATTDELSEEAFHVGSVSGNAAGEEMPSPAPTASPAPTESPVPEEEAVVEFTRTVIVEKAREVTFSATALYISVTNTDCDLTQDVTAVDEEENPVTEIYVVEQEELQAAKQVITDDVSGQMREQYLPGQYYITLGAKHPETDEEFTVVREVNVGSGYYLYAPDLEIETAATQYDLLEGVELRSYDDGSTAENAIITVDESDINSLEQIAMTDEEVMEFIEDMEKAGEEPAAAMEAMLLAEEGEDVVSNPPLKEGTYSYEIHAVDEETGETYSTVRMVSARTIRHNYSMWFEAGAYKDRLIEHYKEGDVDGLVLGADMSKIFYRMTGGTLEPSVPNGYSNYIIRTLGERATGFLSSSKFQQHPIRTTYQYNKLGTPTVAEVLGLTVDFEIMKSKDLDQNYSGSNWSYMGALSRDSSASLYGTKTNGQYDEILYQHINNKFFKGELYYTLRTTTKEPSYTGYYAEAYFWDWANQSERRDVSAVHGDWNNYVNGGRDKEQFRYGGEPDVTVTANTGNKITDANLDFENFMTHIENVTPEASIRIDINGEELRGSNTEQELPAMQIALENGKLDTRGEERRLVYTAPEHTWLRFKGFQTTDDLLENTTDHLLSKQLKLTLTGENTVEFLGGDTQGDELFARVENTSGKTSAITLGTETGHGDINVPKYFQVNGADSDYDYTVNAAEGTRIEAFNLSAKKTTESANSPAHSLTLGGGGVLRFNNTSAIPGATATYSQAYAERVDLTGDITVLKSGKSPDGGNAMDLPAVRIANGFLHNGYRIAAGVNKDGNIGPGQNELFAKADNFILDPTDFTVNIDTKDNAWVNDGTWFMANPVGDTSGIVFMQNADIAAKPVQVNHGSTTQRFASYKEALEYIDADVSGDTSYTVTNLRSMDFTEQDLKALSDMTGSNRSIIFTGAKTGAGAITYGDCYHVRFRGPIVEMPEGYEITWNQPVKYDQGNREDTTQKKVPDLIFIGNGGRLNFDTMFQTVDPIREIETAPGTFAAAERKNYVYGGARGGNFTADAEIYIKRGKFEAVYGGNREGSHTGDVSITVDSTQTAEDQIVIQRLDGGSEGEQAKPTGRTAQIQTIAAVTIQNIYNYDKLTVQSGTLTIPEAAAEKAANINAQLARGYLGQTVINDDAALKLMNNNGVRRLGSLTRQNTADPDKEASLILKKAIAVGTSTASSRNNPYLLELTAADPLGVDNLQTGVKLKVSYDNTGDESYGDIIFYLSGVADAEADRWKYVTVDPLNSAFNMVLISDSTSKVLKLAEASVWLMTPDGQKVTKLDVAGAVVEMAQKENNTPGGSYTIAIFKEDYRFSALDAEAMELAYGSKTGSFRYLEQNYTNLSEAGTAAKITWCGNYDASGSQKTNYTTVRPEICIPFFGGETLLEKISFDYSDNKTDKGMYANGIPTTVEATVTMKGAVLPDLYGAGKNAVAGGTKLTVKGGRFDTVYGGGTTNAVTVGGSKEINLPITVELHNIKDYTILNIGDGGTAKATVTVAGTLDSRPGSTLADRTDNVYLKHAELKFAGTEAGHIGNLHSDNNRNTVKVYKNADGTVPLQLDGKVTLTGNQEISVDVNGAAAAKRDVILVFADQRHAIRTQYRTDLTNMMVMNDKKNILLDVDGKLLLTADSINTVITQAGNNGTKDTLYYYSTLQNKTETGRADWTNFGTGHAGIANGHNDPDVTVTAFRESVNRDLFKMKGQIANTGEGTSITYDINDYELFGYHETNWSDIVDDGTQVELKNLKIANLNNKTDFGTTRLPSGGVLRFTNVYTEADYGEDTSMRICGAATPKGNERMEMYFSDVHPYTSFFEWVDVPDLYIKYGVIDNESWHRLGSGIKKAYIDTNGRNTRWFTMGIWQDNPQMDLTLAGGGKVIFSNQQKDSWGNAQTEEHLRLIVNSLALEDSVTIAKSEYHGTEWGAVDAFGDFRSGGHRIYAEVNGNILRGSGTVQPGRAIQDGEVFAGHRNEYAMLDKQISWDPTDFVIKSPDETDTSIPASERLYFTSEYQRKIVKATKLGHAPIQLSTGNTVVGQYDTYAAALKAIPVDGTGEYTITNLIERNFEESDAEVLKSFSNKNVRLKFVSGTRADGIDNGLYRIRVRQRVLQLPENIDVTFENILLKYEQGDGKYLEFVNNGGVLTFGDNVRFIAGESNTETEGKATVYGGSTTNALTGSSTVIIRSGSFTAVYGAGTMPQTGNAAVYAMGGTMDKVFPGGTAGGTVTGNTTISLTGGKTKSPVYGGGEGAKVVGNTEIIISGSYPFTADATDTSTYGGGKGAEVEGDSTIQITINNTAGEVDYTGRILSGSGTDAAGNMADNVSGTKTITVKTAQSANRATLVGEVLTGFDVLNIGNTDAVNCNNLIAKITKRFDSRPVDLPQENNQRDDKVNLITASIVLSGDWQGHIGELHTSGECSIQIPKMADGTTRPLLLDKVPSHTGDMLTLLKNTAGINELYDVILRFTLPEGAGGLDPKEKENYKDGYNPPMDVNQTQKGTGTADDPYYVDIYFDVPPAHIVKGWVEYPQDAVNGTRIDVAGTTTADKVKKIIHLVYDKENKHDVRNGYIIAMPKTVTDAAEMTKYTNTNSGFIADGVFGADMDAYDCWPITFTQNTETGLSGAHAAEGQTEVIEIDSENYWYIAHVVCEKKESYSFLVDVSSPEESTGTSALTETMLDTASGNYIYRLRMQDVSEKDINKLPHIKYGSRKYYLNYDGSGIKEAYWAVSNTVGVANSTADTEAAKDRPQPAGENGLNAAVSVTNVDGSAPVTNANVAVITLEVPKATVDDNKDGVLWVYAKDGVNNTVKLAIPLSPYQIDITVPLKAGVIAVKDSTGGVEELLAPICYIRNNGTQRLETQINSFLADTVYNAANSPELSLAADKPQSADYTEKELALRLKANDAWWNIFQETNVLQVDGTHPLQLGTLEPQGTLDGTSKKDMLSYTFGASYNAWNINYPDGGDGGEMKYTMGYHFKVVK